MNMSGKNYMMKQCGCCRDECLDGEMIDDLILYLMTSEKCSLTCKFRGKLRALVHLLSAPLLAHTCDG